MRCVRWLSKTAILPQSPLTYGVQKTFHSSISDIINFYYVAHEAKKILRKYYANEGERKMEREQETTKFSELEQRVYNSMNFKPIIAHYCYLHFPLFMQQKNIKLKMNVQHPNV